MEEIVCKIIEDIYLRQLTGSRKMRNQGEGRPHKDPLPLHSFDDEVNVYRKTLTLPQVNCCKIRRNITMNTQAA